MLWGTRDITSDPTNTHRRNLELAETLFRGVIADLTRLVTVDIAGLEKQLDEAGAPYTPGRIPVWPDR